MITQSVGRLQLGSFQLTAPLMTAGTEMLAQDPGAVIWSGDMKRQAIWNSQQKARHRAPYLVSDNGKKRRGYYGQTEEKKKTASVNGKALGTSLVCSLEKNHQKILKQSVQYLNHFSLWLPSCFWDANFIAIKKLLYKNQLHLRCWVSCMLLS